MAAPYRAVYADKEFEREFGCAPGVDDDDDDDVEPNNVVPVDGCCVPIDAINPRART